MYASAVGKRKAGFLENFEVQFENKKWGGTGIVVIIPHFLIGDSIHSIKFYRLP